MYLPNGFKNCDKAYLEGSEQKLSSTVHVGNQWKFLLIVLKSRVLFFVVHDLYFNINLCTSVIWLYFIIWCTIIFRVSYMNMVSTFKKDNNGIGKA